MKGKAYLCPCLNEKRQEMAKIIVQKKEITVVTVEDKDYISLTDMANAKLKKGIFTAVKEVTD